MSLRNLNLEVPSNHRQPGQEDQSDRSTAYQIKKIQYFR